MVHSLWSYIGFCAETAIFLLAGVIMATELTGYITWVDFLKNLGLYVLLHIIRFLGIVMFLPFMNCVNYKLDIKTCVFLAYAGLRGAVGLSLALVLKNNEKIPKAVASLILFHVCGIVILTLFVNGMTAGFLLAKLGLSKESKISKKLMVDFLDEMD